VKTETVAATLLRDSQAAAIQHAIQLLRRGEVVAVPTETVYGLAADALNPVAVARIFEAKARPFFDPLIVHLPGEDWLERVAKIDNRSRSQMEKLISRFWPGPLTLVLARQPTVPDIVTAGLDTVAVRISSHPVFAQIVSAFGKPLAAPSANRFGRISPTAAQHVQYELHGRIPFIIDGGSTPHGIESTIIAVKDNEIHVLRRGPVTVEQLSEFGEIHIATSSQQVCAPGQMPSHYAPRTPLRLIDNADSCALPENHRVGLLAWQSSIPKARFAAARILSERQDLREAAANLFRYLRELDELNCDLIVAERVPSQGLGAAILDRLKRASHDSDIPGTLE